MKTNSERLNQLRTLIRGSQFTSEDIFETAINQIVNQTFVTNVDIGAVELLEEVETIVEIMQRLEADERLQALDFAGRYWQFEITDELFEFISSVVQEFETVVFTQGNMREAVTFASKNKNKNVICLSVFDSALAEIEMTASFLQIDNLRCQSSDSFRETQRYNKTGSMIELVLSVGFRLKPHGHSDDIFFAAEIAQNYQHPAIFLLSDSALFKGGSAISSRGILVETGRLAGVISLDFRQGIKWAGVGTNLLILHGSSSKNDQFFFSSQRIKSATELNSKSEIITQLLFGVPPFRFDDGMSQAIEARSIALNNFILNPERYLETEASKALDIFTSRHETQRLGEIFEIIRPIPIKSEKVGEYQVNELMIGDLKSGETIELGAANIAT